MHCNLSRPTSHQSFRFQPNLYCVWANTAISELPIKSVTPPLDSATLICVFLCVVRAKCFSENEDQISLESLQVDVLDF